MGKPSYWINGKTVCSQLNESQYRLFLSVMKQPNVGMDEAFRRAKLHGRRKSGITVPKPTYTEVSREARMRREVRVLQKMLNELEALFQHRKKKPFRHALPIPLNAKPELESVILATRIGSVLMALGDK